eukprot:snap_masked-scaffold_1-processed-gene-30.44-mRNA-1 protein AED:0.41 eAED:0.41 QI:0/-1/0/1/-1/1/1/0/113
MASVPNDVKGLRACMSCLLVKTFTQFYEEGCDNCQFLQMTEDRDRCEMATTSDYQGFVAVMKPEQSWVSRWIRVSNLIPGCYAIKVNETLHPSLEKELEENGVPNLGKISQLD